MIETSTRLKPLIREIYTDQIESDVVIRLKKMWIGQFYFRFIRNIYFLNELAPKFFWNIYPIYKKYSFKFFNSSVNASRHRFPLIKLCDYIEKTGIPMVEATQSERHTHVSARTFPADSSSLTINSRNNLESPSVYMAKVSDVIVRGGTNLVFTKDAVICHDFYSFKEDFTSEELHGRHQINPKKNTITVFEGGDNYRIISLPIAASFVDACSSNYAHWLTEVLPRIAVFCSLSEYRGVPIIIDSLLHKNIISTLNYVVGTDREIFTLSRGASVKVDVLCMVSATGYIPFDWRKGGSKNPGDHSQGRFSSSSLKLVQEALSPYWESCKERATPHKIYLRRDSAVRSVTNESEISEILFANGYVAVEPEKMTFLEQVILFANAIEIVAPSGAALANAIFCRPNTKICILMGRHKRMIYSYWLNMLHSFKLEIVYIFGDIDSNKSRGIHGNYSIDLNDLKNFLNMEAK